MVATPTTTNDRHHLPPLTARADSPYSSLGPFAHILHTSSPRHTLLIAIDTPLLPITSDDINTTTGTHGSISPHLERIEARRAEIQSRATSLISITVMATDSGLKRKVVILGSPSVGKTSITQQFTTPPTYNEAYYPTIESTSTRTVKYKGKDYEVEIVDTAGQDEFSLFPPKYAIGVHGYMLVYSIASRQSFEMITTLHEKILDQGGLEKVPCVIVGQKSDLANERRVTKAEGEALAKKLGAAFVESSARDNQNIDVAFDALLGEMQREYNPEPEKKKSSWWPWS
ncbi:GTP-binding protein rhb1 [Vanrija pseudolonga]|uniref:GTP-binding protein rhb1 n=1 Tax=Vanrija pseudolonga TaxID=143232 RepID=A0AAF0Y362_9TREE|nr:GTP-binding protein rhb1 [Vanrija pseudolonga]